MRDADDRAGDQKNVTEREEHERRDETDAKNRKLDKRRFRFLRDKRSPSLNEPNKGTQQRKQTADKPARPRGRAGARGSVRHLAQRVNAGKLSPKQIRYRAR